MSEWAELIQETSLRRVILAHRAERAGFAAGRLPDGVELDLRTGEAWSTHAAYEVVPGPGRRHRQLEVRACVVGPFGPGVVVLDTWVDRMCAPLTRPRGRPRRFDPELRLEVEDDEGRVRARAGRVRLLGGIIPDSERRPRSGSVDAFLLEREWVYGESLEGCGWAVRVAHEPLEVRRASLLLEDRGPASVGHYAAAPGPTRVVELRRLPTSLSAGLRQSA